MLEIKTRMTHGFMEVCLEGHVIDIIYNGDNAIIDETVDHLETIIEQLKTYKND